MNVTEHKSEKIVMRTCNKTQKYLIAHNFFNFDHNIGMLMRGCIDERNSTA